MQYAGWYRRERHPPKVLPSTELPQVPVLRRDVDAAWETWLMTPAGARSLGPATLPEVWSPLPPGWAFTPRGKVVKICLGIGQGLGMSQYEVTSCFLSPRSKSWVRSHVVLPSVEPGHYISQSHKATLARGIVTAREMRLPFDPSLRHGMPDRPPDDAWVGATWGTTGWYVKIYRKWNDRARPFAEVMAQRLSPQKALHLAQQVAKRYGLPIRGKMPAGGLPIFAGVY